MKTRILVVAWLAWPSLSHDFQGATQAWSHVSSTRQAQVQPQPDAAGRLDVRVKIDTLAPIDPARNRQIPVAL